jgi:hypothetical protein
VHPEVARKDPQDLPLEAQSPNIFLASQGKLSNSGKPAISITQKEGFCLRPIPLMLKTYSQRNSSTKHLDDKEHGLTPTLMKNSGSFKARLLLKNKCGSFNNLNLQKGQDGKISGLQSPTSYSP